MGLRKLLGIFIISLPFMAIFSLIAHTGGLVFVLSILLSVAFILGCTLLGLYLIERG